jgi:hypothetical protein
MFFCFLFLLFCINQVSAASDLPSVRSFYIELHAGQTPSPAVSHTAFSDIVSTMSRSLRAMLGCESGGSSSNCDKVAPVTQWEEERATLINCINVLSDICKFSEIQEIVKLGNGILRESRGASTNEKQRALLCECDRVLKSFGSTRVMD